MTSILADVADRATVTACHEPVPHLTMSLALGYTDAKFTQTVLEGQGAILVADGDHRGGPPLTTTLSGEYDIPVGSQDLRPRF